MANDVTNQSPTAGQHKEFWSQIGFGQINKTNFQLYLEQKKSSWIPPEINAYLQFVGKTKIKPTEASECLSEENRYPFSEVSRYFNLWDVEFISKNTREVTAYVYEQIRDGSHLDFFNSFDRELDLLSFETDKQIKEFVEKNPSLLHPVGGCMTYFLINDSKGRRYVIPVRKYSTGETKVYLEKFFGKRKHESNETSRFVILGR